MGSVMLAIDAGTTGVTALLVDEQVRVVGRGYREFPQHFPAAGWVEHDPDEIWDATLVATRAVLDIVAERQLQVGAIGITNQRETAVLWQRQNLSAPRRAVVWQDRRSAQLCRDLIEAGHHDRVAHLTGLRLDPYFTATKLSWLRQNEPQVWAGVESGELAVGTVDSYLIAKMSGGAAHVTDASNASRTLLCDLSTGQWSPELCELFGVAQSALPTIVSSWGEVARTDPDAFLGLDVPIAGIAGDQQAALFGQACFENGQAKCTYGTGSFLLVNSGSEIPDRGVASPLLSTIAWRSPEGELTYAAEGSIFVTGSAVQWLRDGLNVIENAHDTAELARSVESSDGVVFVPALAGLGAPWWDPDARGLIIGLTRGTTKAHLVRATLEAIAFQVRDVVKSQPGRIPVLRVDGGAAANDLLMQIQADQLGVPVERASVLETTGLGAAMLAGLGTGVWSSRDELAKVWSADRRFEPGQADDRAYARWTEAVRRSRRWTEWTDSSSQ